MRLRLGPVGLLHQGRLLDQLQHLSGRAHVLEQLSDTTLGRRQRMRLEEVLDLRSLLEGTETRRTVHDDRVHQTGRGLGQLLTDVVEVLHAQRVHGVIEA